MQNSKLQFKIQNFLKGSIFKKIINNQSSIINAQGGFTQHHFYNSNIIKELKKRIGSGAGFTFIELLAVMVVVVVVGSVVVGIITSTLRGTNKTNTLNDVRANGNYAVLQISRSIEFAQGFLGVSQDGSTYITFCEDPSTQYKHIRLRSADGGITTFSCIAEPPSVALNGSSLVNTDSISVAPCFFTCSQGSIAESPTIGINMSFSDKSASSFSEQQTTIPFNTSVKIRNPNR